MNVKIFLRFIFKGKVPLDYNFNSSKTKHFIDSSSCNVLIELMFIQVVFHLDRALEVAPACTRLRVVKAECLAFLGRYQEAQELAIDMVSADQTNADAIYVRGLCLFYQDNVDRAFSHFQHVLRIAPDHSKAIDIYKVCRVNFICSNLVVRSICKMCSITYLST